MDRPIQIDPHSRIDTWRQETEKPMASYFKPQNQPLHVQARSKVDTWGSITRSKTIHIDRRVCMKVCF